MARRGRPLPLLLLLTLLAFTSTAVVAAEAEAGVEVTAPAQYASEVDPTAAKQGQEQHLLPRPLVIELPSSSSAPPYEEGLEGLPSEVAAPAQRASDVDPAAAAQQQEQHLLPRPLVIELPSSLSSSSCAPPYEEGLEGLPSEVRCASWRLAAEANNLAPWKAVPAECAAHVRDYVNGAAYRSDLDLVARESDAFARAAPRGDDGRDAWVFDVDETLLSNLPYYAEHGYGLELFDHHAFDDWVERGEAPAIPSSLKLYKEVRELGFKTFLLTGRSEGHQGVTVDNLKKQGFHDWDKLILRTAVDRNKTAMAYKSGKRKEMEAEGYRIIGNSGDQWSDLLGSSVAVRSFKLPNPMYYIP